MKYSNGVLFLCVLGSELAAQSPVEIVERTIQAHGGGEALAKMKAVEQTARGKFHAFGPTVDAERVGKLALPDRALWTLNIARDKTVICLNGLSGWMQRNNDPASDLSPGMYELIADEGWVHGLCTIVPLLQKNLKLSGAGQIQVESQSADGVRVAKDGRPEVTLYFSKSNGLLLKAQARIKDAGKTVNKEWLFAAHKEFSGVRLPAKITDLQDGNKQAEWTAVEYKFVEKFDPAVFRKP